MEEEAIFIGYLAESVAKATSISDDSQCKIDQVEVITFVMISVLYSHCKTYDQAHGVF